MGKKVTARIYSIPIIEVKFLKTTGKSIQGGRKNRFLVEADNEDDAMAIVTSNKGFIRNYNSLPDKEKREVIGFWLDSTLEVIIEPECELRHKNDRGQYICGRQIADLNGHQFQNDESSNLSGEFGGCVLDSFDAPEERDCPYNKD
jgi:hypothetical protein